MKRGPLTDLPLFFNQDKTVTEGLEPLAEALRPKSFKDFIGQEHILGPNSRWQSVLTSGPLPSLILTGPPGTGKTSFAKILCQTSNAHFESVNAVDTSIKILREYGNQGQDRRLIFKKRTLLFLDEIHRLNKSQQDSLLPYVESGDLILIGATTENPNYEVNRALLSRCKVLEFKALTHEHLKQILARTLSAKLRDPDSFLTEDGQRYLIQYANGDARRLIQSLELMLSSGNTPLPWTSKSIEDLLQIKSLAYDKASNLHYDTISAFIKSIRGSDPDAALYYLAYMLEAGEDPLFIARRLIILASEDVGNADPKALPLAVAAAQTVEMIGLPEARISLSQVATYLATAPKSNAAYLAINKATEFIKTHSLGAIPPHLRSGHPGYQYPHNFPKGYVPQRYWPDSVPQDQFYQPTTHGYESHIREYLAWLKK